MVQPEPLPTVMLCERLGSDTRFGLDYHVMLFEAAFTRISLLGQGMLMGQAKIVSFQ